ncbi:MAG TPA: cation:proton antiporter, partial [Candidatus Limnocylindrales bacterium]
GGRGGREAPSAAARAAPMITPLTVFAVAVLGYSLVSRRLASSVVTMPIFFVTVGFLAGPVAGLVHVDPADERLVLLLEAALVMVLFADSSALDVHRWTREPALSGRLLGIGLPLTMLAGALVAIVVVPGIAPWQAGLIGVILAPTDAALGQAVVANPRVPAVVRNALNVESGLNDGLVLPFVTIVLAIAEVATGGESEITALATLVFVFAVSTTVGLVVGLGGGWLLRIGADRRLAARRWHGIALVAIAIAAFAIADGVHASGFLAVWVAGLTAGAMVRSHVDEDSFHLTERGADILAAASFAMLGAAIVGPILARATLPTVVYVVLSLTLVRMVPVAVAMVRTGFAWPTTAYIGWFGPRGLASIVFAAVVVEAAIPGSQLVTDVVLLTVSVSIVAHGVTAAWGARRYAGWFDRAVARDPAIAEAAAPVAAGIQGRAPRAAALVEHDAG